MIITKDSHLDHGLTSEHLKLLFELFGNHEEFFIETVAIDAPLPLVPCGLYGPIMGDPKITASQVEWRKREGRGYQSRIITRCRSRLRDRITVIAGPHEDHKCMLYTAFGGPLAPKEPRDPSLSDEDREASETFWSQHALVWP